MATPPPERPIWIRLESQRDVRRLVEENERLRGLIQRYDERYEALIDDLRRLEARLDELVAAIRQG